MTTEKLIIIGSGPAAYSAAIYSSRAQLSPLVVEGSVDAGGALMNTTDVDNYPGFPSGVQGPELMDAMRAQAARFGARFLKEDALAVRLTSDLKGVKTSDGATHKSLALIVATGSAHKKLALSREEELAGRGVSYCAVCDAPFFKGQNVIVVGGGDTACEEALALAKFASSVTMLIRGGAMRASKAMEARVRANPLIALRFHTRLEELRGTPLSEVSLLTSEGSETMKAEGVFVAIGLEPRSQLFTDYLPMDELGYILPARELGHGATATSIEGVFVAGDVADHRYRQAITAAATGVQASLDAERWLTENS